MMTGCTEDVYTKSPVSFEDAWMYDESLPVPVQFGTSGVMTKAMIESSSDMVGRNFRVFAFDRDSDAILTEDDGLMLRDGVAQCVAKDGKAVLNLKSPYYYPQYSETNFSFYSYYSSATSENLTVEVDSRRVCVTMPVAVTTDILWAKSYVEAGNGYNAEYMRKGNSAPTFKFSHPAACLSFKASLKTDLEDEIRISRVALNDIPTMAELCVVDYDNSENEGKFESITQTGTKYLTTSSTGNLNLLLTTESQQLGRDVFIFPCATVSLLVYLSVNGMAYKDPIEYVINSEDFDPDLKQFEPGYRYQFNLKVNSPKKVEVELEVDAYESAFGGGKYDPDGYKDEM